MMKRSGLTIGAVAALLAASGVTAVQADQWSAGYDKGSIGAHYNDARGSAASTAGAGSIGGGWAITAGSDASPVGGNADAVAGGVGLNARAMLSNDAAADHNVKLVFSLASGNYLADVHVKVNDTSGRTVIDGMSDGPWLYAQLPPGKYIAAATYAGHTVMHNFTVGERGMRTAHLRWPDSVERQATASTSISPILGTGPQEFSPR